MATNSAVRPRPQQESTYLAPTLAWRLGRFFCPRPKANDKTWSLDHRVKRFGRTYSRSLKHFSRPMMHYCHYVNSTTRGRIYLVSAGIGLTNNAQTNGYRCDSAWRWQNQAGGVMIE
jgi:hypothetical protein